ncbi:agmatinase [Candidatus Margulisiibacteriota bacterium]
MLNFLGSEINPNYSSSQAVILPIPYERTTSYFKGTENGPQEILKASSQLELYDSELKTEIAEIGIYTLPELEFKYTDYREDLNIVYEKAGKELKNNKWILSLGGEHTVTVPLYKAVKENSNDDIGFVHLDAHFDLRASYEGSKYSHACVLKRVRELTSHTLSIGIRAFSKEEADFAKVNKIMHVTDKDIYYSNYDLPKLLNNLPEKIYLTIDLDFFSPAVIPGLGTPVPGGPDWWTGLSIIRQIFNSKDVVAADIVELCPNVEGFQSPFTAAMLAYKCLGYKFSKSLC